MGDELKGSLSGIEIPSMPGGVSPQSEPAELLFPDIEQSILVYVPLVGVKLYNLSHLFGYLERDVRAVCGSGMFDSWGNGYTAAFLFRCNHENFERLRTMMKKTIGNFGGRPDLAMYHLTGGATEL